MLLNDRRIVTIKFIFHLEQNLTENVDVVIGCQKRIKLKLSFANAFDTHSNTLLERFIFYLKSFSLSSSEMAKTKERSVKKVINYQTFGEDLQTNSKRKSYEKSNLIYLNFSAR